jgi:hypothetical protein
MKQNIVRVRAVINDDSCDRSGIVVLSDGCRWDGFMSTGGPVLCDHGSGVHGIVPIGTVESIEMTTHKGKRSIIANMRFFEDDAATRQLRERYLSGKTGGFEMRCLPNPDKTSPPTKAEVESRPDWSKASLVYREWTLVEISLLSSERAAS